MQISTTIKLAQTVEDMAGDMYHQLALRSAAAPEEAAVFRRLEQEEREHAKRLQMLASMYLKDPRSFRGTELEIPQIEGIVAKMKALKEEIEQGTVAVSVAAARLVELEERFSVTHAEVVARNADPSVKALFTMLASQDREHAKLLQNLGVKPR
jgi:rubrerythrin